MATSRGIFRSVQTFATFSSPTKSTCLAEPPFLLALAANTTAEAPCSAAVRDAILVTSADIGPSIKDCGSEENNAFFASAVTSRTVGRTEYPAAVRYSTTSFPVLPPLPLKIKVISIVIIIK